MKIGMLQNKISSIGLNVLTVFNQVQFVNCLSDLMLTGFSQLPFLLVLLHSQAFQESLSLPEK